MAPSISQEPATPGQRNGSDPHGEIPVAPRTPQEPPAPGHRGESRVAVSGRWHAIILWCRLRRRPGAGAKHSQPLEVFRTQVEHARALLAFGITEGRRYKDGELQITPELIEQILQAEDLLHRQVTPTWQERADFEKAYWHLTRALTPVTAALLAVPRWQQSRWFWVVMAGVYLGFAVLWAGVFQSAASLEIMKFTKATFAIVLFSALLSTTLVGFLWRFAYWFTGIVTRQKLNQIISFCYAFTLLAILSPLLMVGALLMLPLDLYRILALDSPIAITLGCSIPLPGEAPNAIPAEIRCGRDGIENHQWVVNVGGTPTRQTWPKEGDAEAKEFWRRPRLHLNGGVIVPVYIIVLAFIGGAVSMTRRVPEYQRRAADPSDSMTPEDAREAFVFQIMQVVSAPLIAVTLYHLVGPTSRATSIALGFAAGFASEPILVGIRALVEKLLPVRPAPVEK